MQQRPRSRPKLPQAVPRILPHRCTKDSVVTTAAEVVAVPVAVPPPLPIDWDFVAGDTCPSVTPRTPSEPPIPRLRPPRPSSALSSGGRSVPRNVMSEQPASCHIPTGGVSLITADPICSEVTPRVPPSSTAARVPSAPKRSRGRIAGVVMCDGLRPLTVDLSAACKAIECSEDTVALASARAAVAWAFRSVKAQVESKHLFYGNFKHESAHIAVPAGKRQASF